LYFTHSGDYIFRQVVDGATRSKYLNARDVASAFGDRTDDSGWLPEGILRLGYGRSGAWYVYVRAPGEAEIRLAEKERVRTLSIPIPGTILVGMGVKYFLLCYPGNILDLDKPICNAPFPNVNLDGQICWGKNQPPAVCTQTAETAWKLFFESTFNADLANNKCRSYPGDVRKLLRKLKEEIVFPDEELIRKDHSVRAYLERLIKVEEE
jgi:hypothetical protein